MRPLTVLITVVDDAIKAHDKAALEAVIEELATDDSMSARALAARSRAVIDRMNNEFDSALRSFEEARSIYTELEDHESLTRIYNGIGTTHYSRSEHDQALVAFREALAHATITGDLNNIAGSLANIGNVFNNTSSYASAIEHYNRALDLYKQGGDIFGTASTYYNLTIAFYRSSNYAVAMDQLNHALDIYTQLDNAIGMARCLHMTGALYHRLEKFEEAIEAFKRSYDISASIDYVRGCANAKGDMANCYHALREYGRAIELLTETIEVQKSISNVQSVVNEACNLATVYLDTGNIDEAERVVRSLDSCPVSTPLLNVRKEMVLSQILIQRGEFEKAKASLEQVVENCEEHGFLLETSLAYDHLLKIAMSNNDLQKYIQYSTASQAIKEQITGKETVLRIASQEAERRATAERQEREKERAVLYSTLPKHIADRIVRGEQVTGDHYDNAAVIFVDIVGFTQISDQLSASDVVTFLERLFSQFDEICKRHGVTKIKTIGDSYMAVAFADSLPRDARDDSASDGEPGEEDVIPNEVKNAYRAANAALGIMRAVADFPSPASSPLSVRLGVHCGALTAGVIGTERLQYDVWGDTVNVASRLESTGEPGKIQVSEAFAQSLGSASLGLRPRNDTAREDDSQQREEGIPVIPSNSEEPGTWHVARGTWHLALRGDIELKGKGQMTTYWLVPAP